MSCVRGESSASFDDPAVGTDPVQDAFLATRRCVDDRGDCQQWHALLAVVAGRRRLGAGACSDYLPGDVCPVHELAAYSVQAEAS